jgi:hypothetical protein
LKFLSFGYEVFIGFKKAKIEFFNALLLHRRVVGLESLGRGKFF